MPEPLSPEDYAATGGMCCPACGGTTLYPSSLKKLNLITVRQVSACAHCRATWTAVYKLTGYEGLRVPMEDAADA